MVTGLIREPGRSHRLRDQQPARLPGRTYVAGARTLHTYGWGPVAGTAFNITQVSTAGHLDIGVQLDPAAVTEPALLRRPAWRRATGISSTRAPPDGLSCGWRRAGSAAGPPIHEWRGSAEASAGGSSRATGAPSGSAPATVKTKSP